MLARRNANRLPLAGLPAAINAGYQLYQTYGAAGRRAANAVGRAYNAYRSRKRSASSALPGARTRARRLNNSTRRLRQAPAQGSASSAGSRRFTIRPYKRAYKYRKSVRRRSRKSSSYYRSKVTMKHLMDMVCTPQVTKTTRSFFKVSDGNGCRTWSVNVLCSLNNLIDYSNRASRGRLFGGTPGTAGSLTPLGRPKHLFVDSFVSKYILQNRSNWDMKLKVYECLVRRDLSLNGQTPTVMIIGNMFRASDDYGVDKDVLQPSYAGGTDSLATVDQNPTYTPYMSQQFVGNFKIIKTSTFDLGCNDYMTYVARARRRRFDYSKIVDSANSGPYPDLIGKWSKVLLFTWVGGPVDTNTVDGNAKQSKAQCDLFVQVDTTVHFHTEPGNALMYNIASSNATTSQLGQDTTNTYSTDSTISLRVPATQVVENVANTSGDDVAPEHP